MEKSKKSKHKKNIKQTHPEDSDSSHSTLSINPDESLVNNLAHNLFILAIKKERQQVKNRQQNPKLPTIKQRQTKLIKKKKLTIDDIDRLFEEKRLRPFTIKTDLIDLYQKSTGRIRSMLDIHQIDQFIQTTENRKII